MNFNIRIEGIKELTQKLNDISKKQLPFALAKALTNTAQAVKAAEIEEMKKVFDRPTPYTLKSLFIESATKSKLQSKVWVKDEAVKYITPHISGGERKVKRSEMHLQRARRLQLGMFLTPGQGAKLNKYGNISGGKITQILSVLKAHPDPYAWTSKRSRQRNKKLPEYFAISGEKPSHLAPGVYQRSGRKIKPILAFVKKPQYKQRYKFFDVAQKIVAKEFWKKFEEAFKYAMATRK